MALKVNIKLDSFVGKGNGVYSAYAVQVDGLRRFSDALVNAVPDEDADIIHHHNFSFDFLRLAMLYRHKLVITAHVVPDSFTGSLALAKLWSKPARDFLRYGYSQARLVLAVSPQVRVDLREVGVTVPITVVPNSVDRALFRFDPAARKAFRARYSVPRDAHVVLGVGQVQPRKGIDDFIETARRFPAGLFIWAGGRPYGRLTADYDRLTRLMDKAPKNVRFIGQVELAEMPGLYSMADAYFLPSYHENFAFATIEAASVGLPLVLRDIPAYRTSLHDRYLSGNDAADFAAILFRLRAVEPFRDEWRRRSEALAVSYDLERFCGRLMDIYASIVEENQYLLSDGRRSMVAL